MESWEQVNVHEIGDSLDLAPELGSVEDFEMRDDEAITDLGTEPGGDSILGSDS